MGGKRKNFKWVWRRKDQSMASSSVPPPPPPPWIELPRDITANILQRLGAVDILESAQKVCTTWRSVCQDPSMWRKIDMSSHADDDDYDVEIMCQHAVDRSQGQLVDIRICYFGTDYLLDYIAERSSQLRCLSLASCDGISGEGLTEAVRRFPLLEELHLFVILIPCEFIEIVGRSCPILKSFTLNKRRSRVPPLECDDEALAIAKTMPELRHLSVFGNKMTNEGLVAILDGCTHLQSLDLRLCYGVNLGGDLGKRCSQQLKYLRQPYDSTADYEYDAQIDSDSFDGYPYGLSDLDIISDDEEYYFSYDDFTRWDVDSDYEDFFGAFVMDGYF